MSNAITIKIYVPRRYIKAYENEELVNQVFDAFKKNELKLKEISEMSGIPYGTIQFWHNKFVANPTYRPGKAIGQHRRIFTPEQEENIAQMIKEQFIDHHVIIHRKHLQKLLFNMWQSLDPESRSGITCDHFMSRKFVKLFCKRHKLSFRQMRNKKRSERKKSRRFKFRNFFGQ